MQHALALAGRGRGAVEPNPMVGSVVADAAGSIVGEGWHERFGGPHAEVNALRATGDRARDGTLFLTLEPCCHHGKTPPCTEAILASGVTRVVIAMPDPFPQVDGRGIAILQAAGIAVTVGVCETEARSLNAPYLKLLSTSRPWVHAKWAMTLDGKIATRTGESKWISNETSRRKGHELRGRMDAILVGRGTVAADDPLLTARPPGPRVATRVIITRSGALPNDCQLLRTAKEVPVLIYTGLQANLKAWSDAGVEVVTLADIASEAILNDLGRRRFTNVLLEGGPGMLGSFFDVNAVDEVHVFIASKIIGGADAPGPIGGIGLARLNKALKLAKSTVEHLDGNIYLQGRLADAGGT